MLEEEEKEEEDISQPNELLTTCQPKSASFLWRITDLCSIIYLLAITKAVVSLLINMLNSSSSIKSK